MARAKKKKEEAVFEPSERWKSIQLTPEQKAELRAQLMKDVERARADGVYERLAALRTKAVREREMRGKK